ncbi:hypothetical protein ABZP36_009075, partial [Zizania latifolia]
CGAGLPEKITFVSEERTMSASNNVDSNERVDMECSLVGGNISDSDVRIGDINNEDEGDVSIFSPGSMRKIENVGTDGNVNNEKGFITHDGCISNEVCTTPSSLVQRKSSLRNNNVNCQEIVAGCQLDGETESRSNNVNCQEIVPGCQQDDITEPKSNSFSAGTKDRSQPFEGLRVESHEDLIEELMRSLSLSDDEEDFVDIGDDSELNDALRSQMGSCRFSSGNKMNDAPRTDPHGQLIEELEMSFSDAEELLGQNVMHILDMGGANLYEDSVSPLDDGHIISGQNFQQNELADVSMQEKEEGHPANHAEADSGTVPVLSNLSNKRFCAIMLLSLDNTTEEKFKTYIGRKLRQGLSLDSEEFRSIQNVIESQMDGTSSPLSSGSPSHGDLEHRKSNRFKKIDRLERLKKMDDLRDQLNRLSSQKGFECLQQQSSYKHIEHHPCGFDDDSMLSSGTIDPYCDHEKLPKYQPPVPFSPTPSCCHYGHKQPHIPYNCNAWEFNSYYQSSCA